MSPEFLDDAGRHRRDRWLSQFLYSMDGPPSSDDNEGSSDHEQQLDAMLTHYQALWNQAVAPFFAELYAATGLEPKVVELIATALLALRGWETGVRAHTALALDSGATPEEIRGAILVTLGVGGIAAAASGLAWAEPILAARETDAV